MFIIKKKLQFNELLWIFVFAIVLFCVICKKRWTSEKRGKKKTIEIALEKMIKFQI